MRTRITLECTECKNRNYNMTKDKKSSSGTYGNQEILQILQVTHTAQGNKVVAGREVDVMSEKKKTQKTSWFKGLQAEFRKIVWPDRKTLAKQTTAVVVVSVFPRTAYRGCRCCGRVRN